MLREGDEAVKVSTLHELLRPEGLVSNSRAREGVEIAVIDFEARRADTSCQRRFWFRTFGAHPSAVLGSTPSRAWLLNAGPSGLRSLAFDLFKGFQLIHTLVLQSRRFPVIVFMQHLLTGSPNNQ